MKVFIYNPNSFGGNYQYAIKLYEQLKTTKNVQLVVLILPENSNFIGLNVFKFLKSDITTTSFPIFKKFYFLYRIILNSIIFWNWLRQQESAYVLFNDFDQWSACITKYLFILLKSKHRFGVVLHDPDRDHYTPWRWLSQKTMQCVMQPMDVGFYHYYLPDKPYYSKDTTFISIPHGIYTSAAKDDTFYQYLVGIKGIYQLLSVVGNIRAEKNYRLIIEAMCYLPSFKLLIAGKAANSSISIQEYKKLAQKLGVADQIIWEERYLTESEMSAVFSASDYISLYYKKSFTSQSGILNQVAPFKKKVIIADGNSGMAALAKQFEIGIIVPPENVEAFVRAIQNNLESKSPETYNQAWEAYMSYASWENSANIIVSTFNKLCP